MGTRQLELLVKERYRSGTITIKDALQFFDHLLATKSPAPSIYSFNHLFTALTRIKNSSNHYATVFSLFNRWTQTRRVSPSPDICTYCILIAYCIRMNRQKLGLVFLGRFIKSRQRADARIFNPLLKGLCYENRISEAVAMAFNKMPKLGCKPNVISYSTVIDGLCKEGAISNAFGLFERMLSEGIVPNVITYNSLINGLCKEGDTEMAEEQLSNMVSQGLKPNVVTYNTLVDGLCKKGLLDKAVEMLQSMVSSGHDPNVVTYNTIIDAQCKVGEIENAEELLHEMISIGPNRGGSKVT
ncbi:pentatricopeptide repeat-containing protein At3g61360-like isoform X2 [Carex rostrata]